MNGIDIKDNMTNGELLKTLFPEFDCDENVCCDGMFVTYTTPDGRDESIIFDIDWWNATYERH